MEQASYRCEIFWDSNDFQGSFSSSTFSASDWRTFSCWLSVLYLCAFKLRIYGKVNKLLVMYRCTALWELQWNGAVATVAARTDKPSTTNTIRGLTYRRQKAFKESKELVWRTFRNATIRAIVKGKQSLTRKKLAKIDSCKPREWYRTAKMISGTAN